jgi:hypothetical protein
MKRILIIVFLVLCVWAQPGLSQDETIGVVKTKSGEAYVLRAGTKQTLQIGDKLRERDTLETDKEATLGVILRDDTVISLGPETRISVDSFIFDPAEGRLGIATSMTKGTVAYLAGKIVKLAPESARFETPLATLGIRGTRFVAGVQD